MSLCSSHCIVALVTEPHYSYVLAGCIRSVLSLALGPISESGSGRDMGAGTTLGLRSWKQQNGKLDPQSSCYRPSCAPTALACFLRHCDCCYFVDRGGHVFTSPFVLNCQWQIECEWVALLCVCVLTRLVADTLCGQLPRAVWQQQQR